MNNPRKLSLDEIISLPKASVIWREEHFCPGGNQGLDFYQLEPMLVCVPGKNGVLAWANTETFQELRINRSLINERRSFWNAEPDPIFITSGIPESDYDQFINNFEGDIPHEIDDSRLLYEITHRGFTVGLFSQATGIKLERLINILLDPDLLMVSELEKIVDVLSLNAAQATAIFFP